MGSYSIQDALDERESRQAWLERCAKEHPGAKIEELGVGWRGKARQVWMDPDLSADDCTGFEFVRYPVSDNRTAIVFYREFDEGRVYAGWNSLLDAPTLVHQMQERDKGEDHQTMLNLLRKYAR